MLRIINIDEKKEGRDMPITEQNKTPLSINVSLFNAVTTPKNTPIINAKQIADIAKTNVFLKVSLIIEVTVVPILTKDSLK